MHEKEIYRFKCNYESCEKVFKHNRSLKEHLRIHEGIKPFKCPFQNCEKSFNQSQTLKKHLRIHNNEKPYKCDFQDCAASFNQKNNLLRHKKVHLNEYNFECPECKKSFLTNFNFKQHLITHTSKENRTKYKCELCDKKYSNNSSLNKHIKEIHAENKKEDANIMAILVKHEDHEDYLIKGILWHLNKNNELIRHELKTSEINPSVCNPVNEWSHISSYKELGNLYRKITETEIHAQKIDFDMLINENICNSFICKCPTCTACNRNVTKQIEVKELMENCGSHNNIDEKENIIKEKKDCCKKVKENLLKISEKNNEDNTINNKIETKSKKCLCKETQKYKHKHSFECIHPSVYHDDHIDYIVEGVLHHPHYDHCDDHGILQIIYQ